MKILIIRFSSIGDIVLTTPVARCLKLQIPNAEIHFCTKRMYQSLIETNPYIDYCHCLDDSLPNLIRRLYREQYDCVIDLHNNLRTKLIKLTLRTYSYTINKRNIRKWLYIRLKLNSMPDEHIVDRYMATLKPLKINNDGLGLDYFIPDSARVTKDQLPFTHQQAYIAYAIGGQHATKRLPLARIIELCRQLNQPIILLGSPEDREVGEAVQQELGDQLIFNACGLYSLNQSASLLQQARIVFSHDTGLMHIAAALKKPIYSIWGNTTPQLGMYPYKTPHIIVENKNLGCRPCSKIGYQSCPRQHFRCMSDLPFNFVLPSINTQPTNVHYQ
ncbi:glycosyltransferase family 9 protein [Spirosoma foliorum]|uniref:Glycosyltransferase family 9 protein n=1 Tax=Spirosoma foliorum TaxID=2710596 RepID=A0A7G5GYM8_9BACT|nr:glycosyltransferase family 9 protein [Spirosoma foliorum]QMW03970.1 glycosyltransferase family 9 protein [Spirosoma foliorum]